MVSSMLPGMILFGGALIFCIVQLCLAQRSSRNGSQLACCQFNNVYVLDLNDYTTRSPTPLRRRTSLLPGLRSSTENQLLRKQN
ncbi:membrane-spanning 4-domains subfamily A member 8-like [Perognathus longimembris pacificus]|uniref:membrane-spanning 4-domains subfamily A member 8-like n=1 Tax=Perognathus longimembris pacificus TaxID=214514 RepID=UPI0020198A2B|nr:membrane-spanning 4-domains subfamily A member 8-like [Perognathus longimembris pacificus]